MFNPETSSSSGEKPKIFMPDEIKKMIDKKAKAKAALVFLMHDFDLNEGEIDAALAAMREKSDTQIYH